MRPRGRVPMHARGAEMLEGVRGDLDDLPVVEHERLRADAAFGHHGHGGDEAELFVEAGAEVGVAQFVEGGRVGPMRGVGGQGSEEGVEGVLEAALGGEVEGEEDEEEG